jgi:hypothetical protein
MEDGQSFAAPGGEVKCGESRVYSSLSLAGVEINHRGTEGTEDAQRI